MAGIISTSHSGYVKDVQFNHDGQRLATCSADSRPRIEVYDKVFPLKKERFNSSILYFYLCI
jgi:WD40 repeat protein